MARAFRVGERVDGLYDANADDVWYPARVCSVAGSESDGEPRYKLQYDDGEVECEVAPACIRAHAVGNISVGSRVIARYAGGDELYAGKVAEVQDNGLYTIEYDDSEVETDVPIEYINEPPEGGEEMKAGEDADDVTVNENQSDSTQAADEPENGRHQDADDVPREAAREEAPITAAAIESEDQNTAQQQQSGQSVQPPATAQVSVQDNEPPSSPPAKRIAFETPSPRSTTDSSSTNPSTVASLESLELLRARLGDANIAKSALSALVKQMRAFPQDTASLVHSRGGEKLLLDVLVTHRSHAVVQCYAFVLLRRLCFLSATSTRDLLANDHGEGVVARIVGSMSSFSDDAILQAAACGALAVFTREQAGLASLLGQRAAMAVLASLRAHRTYSVHTRQVHYYGSEVLLELCELGDRDTMSELCADETPTETSGDASPIELLLFLLRQALSFDDKKACCAVGSLIMCLAMSDRAAASRVLRLNGLPELSTVMAKYATEPGIQKFAAAASKAIALCSILNTAARDRKQQPPSKKVRERAAEILMESSSLESLHQEAHRAKASRGGSNVQRHGGNTVSSAATASSSAGAARKRKINAPGYGVSPRSANGGAAANEPLSFSKFASPIGRVPQFSAFNESHMGPSASREQLQQPQFPQPEQPQPRTNSSLVILDAREERQSLLFDTYGIPAAARPKNSHGGIKRTQLKTHFISAENAWATRVSGQQLMRDEMLAGPAQLAGHHPMTTSRSDRIPSPREAEAAEMMHSPVQQVSTSRSTFEQAYANYNAAMGYTDPNGGGLSPTKPKKKTKKSSSTASSYGGGGSSSRMSGTTALKVRIENEVQQLRTKPLRSPFTSPLSPPKREHGKSKRSKHGASTPKKSRVHSGMFSPAGADSLNAYAAQLFQDDGLATLTSNSKSSARSGADRQERERLSFAEKLHKMIDKAKSTLANSNVTSMPVDELVPATNPKSTSRSDRPSAPSTKTRAPASRQPAVAPVVPVVAAAVPTPVTKKTHDASGSASSTRKPKASASASSASKPATPASGRHTTASKNVSTPQRSSHQTQSKAESTVRPPKPTTPKASASKPSEVAAPMENNAAESNAQVPEVAAAVSEPAKDETVHQSESHAPHEASATASLGEGADIDSGNTGKVAASQPAAPISEVAVPESTVGETAASGESELAEKLVVQDEEPIADVGPATEANTDQVSADVPAGKEEVPEAIEETAAVLAAVPEAETGAADSTSVDDHIPQESTETSAVEESTELPASTPSTAETEAATSDSVDPTPEEVEPSDVIDTTDVPAETPNTKEPECEATSPTYPEVSDHPTPGDAPTVNEQPGESMEVNGDVTREQGAEETSVIIAQPTPRAATPMDDMYADADNEFDDDADGAPEAEAEDDEATSVGRSEVNAVIDAAEDEPPRASDTHAVESATDALDASALPNSKSENPFDDNATAAVSNAAIVQDEKQAEPGPLTYRPATAAYGDDDFDDEDAGDSAIPSDTVLSQEQESAESNPDETEPDPSVDTEVAAPESVGDNEQALPSAITSDAPVPAVDEASERVPEPVGFNDASAKTADADVDQVPVEDAPSTTVDLIVPDQDEATPTKVSNAFGDKPKVQADPEHNEEIDEAYGDGEFDDDGTSDQVETAETAPNSHPADDSSAGASDSSAPLDVTLPEADAAADEAMIEVEAIASTSVATESVSVGEPSEPAADGGVVGEESPSVDAPTPGNEYSAGEAAETTEREVKQSDNAVDDTERTEPAAVADDILDGDNTSTVDATQPELGNPVDETTAPTEVEPTPSTSDAAESSDVIVKTASPSADGDATSATGYGGGWADSNAAVEPAMVQDAKTDDMHEHTKETEDPSIEVDEASRGREEPVVADSVGEQQLPTEDDATQLLISSGTVEDEEVVSGSGEGTNNTEAVEMAEQTPNAETAEAIEENAPAAEPSSSGDDMDSATGCPVLAEGDDDYRFAASDAAGDESIAPIQAEESDENVQEIAREGGLDDNVTLHAANAGSKAAGAPVEPVGDAEREAELSLSDENEQPQDADADTSADTGDSSGEIEPQPQPENNDYAPTRDSDDTTQSDEDRVDVETTSPSELIETTVKPTIEAAETKPSVENEAMPEAASSDAQSPQLVAGDEYADDQYADDRFGDDEPADVQEQNPREESSAPADALPDATVSAVPPEEEVKTSSRFDLTDRYEDDEAFENIANDVVPDEQVTVCGTGEDGEEAAAAAGEQTDSVMLALNELTFSKKDLAADSEDVMAEQAGVCAIDESVTLGSDVQADTVQLAADTDNADEGVASVARADADEQHDTRAAEQKFTDSNQDVGVDDNAVPTLSTDDSEQVLEVPVTGSDEQSAPIGASSAPGTETEPRPSEEAEGSEPLPVAGDAPVVLEEQSLSENDAAPVMEDSTNEATSEPTSVNDTVSTLEDALDASPVSSEDVSEPPYSLSIPQDEPSSEQSEAAPEPPATDGVIDQGNADEDSRDADLPQTEEPSVDNVLSKSASDALPVEPEEPAEQPAREMEATEDAISDSLATDADCESSTHLDEHDEQVTPSGGDNPLGTDALSDATETDTENHDTASEEQVDTTTEEQKQEKEEASDYIEEEDDHAVVEVAPDEAVSTETLASTEEDLVSSEPPTSDDEPQLQETAEDLPGEATDEIAPRTKKAGKTSPVDEVSQGGAVAESSPSGPSGNDPDVEVEDVAVASTMAAWAEAVPPEPTADFSASKKPVDNASAETDDAAHDDAPVEPSGLTPLAIESVDAPTDTPGTEVESPSGENDATPATTPSTEEAHEEPSEAAKASASEPLPDVETSAIDEAAQREDANASDDGVPAAGDGFSSAAKAAPVDTDEGVGQPHLSVEGENTTSGLSDDTQPVSADNDVPTSHTDLPVLKMDAASFADNVTPSEPAADEAAPLSIQSEAAASPTDEDAYAEEDAVFEEDTAPADPPTAEITPIPSSGKDGSEPAPEDAYEDEGNEFDDDEAAPAPTLPERDESSAMIEAPVVANTTEQQLVDTVNELNEGAVESAASPAPGSPDTDYDGFGSEEEEAAPRYDTAKEDAPKPAPPASESDPAGDPPPEEAEEYADDVEYDGFEDDDSSPRSTPSKQTDSTPPSIPSSNEVTPREVDAPAPVVQAIKQEEVEENEDYGAGDDYVAEADFEEEDKKPAAVPDAPASSASAAMEANEEENDYEAEYDEFED